MNKKRNVLLLAPNNGNGGIVSWTRNYLSNYCNDEFCHLNVGMSKRRSKKKEAGAIRRMIDGFLDMLSTYKNVKKVISKNDIAILHATTSGSLGTLRDFIIGRLCQRKGVKAIMHCHYGCVSTDYRKRTLLGWLLKKTVKLYNQIWVLDIKSADFLKKNVKNNTEIHLTPNFIKVPKECDLTPKSYKKVAFVGNLIPSKGLFETVNAVAAMDNDTELFIAGPGSDEVINTIKEIAGNKLGKHIHILGSLPNDKAVELINSVDIISLPSYYKWEAFPISILEAMSRGKIVISTNRAAIPDMLTGANGKQCGIIVEEKSVEDVRKAISWCQQNQKAADNICNEAYRKVCDCYSSEKVFAIYTKLYTKLIYSKI